MRAQFNDLPVTVNPWIKRTLMAAGGLCGGLLAGCTVTPSQPKYPIYMQDRPADTASVPAHAITPDPDEMPPVTGTGSQGAITASELPPPPNSAVPPPPPPPPSDISQVRAAHVGYSYALEPKDTLFGVSRRFGVSIHDIYRLNGLSADSITRPGQKILLPESAHDKGFDERATGAGLVKVNEVAAAPKPVTTPVTPAPVAKPVTTPAPVAVAKPAVSDRDGVARLGKGRFIWPYRGPVLVGYGQVATNVRNDGLNIGGPEGANIVAAAGGTVVYVGDQVRELGNTVYIRHDNGFYTGYSHLGQISVKANQKVGQGEVIGVMGKTGAVDRPQLHFEIRYTPSTDIAKPIDPILVLP